jgi:CHAT domain-containing protein
MACGVGAQVQAGQNAGSCDAVFATAEDMSRGEDAGAQEKALNLYKDALSCYGPAVTERRAKLLSKIARTQLLLSEYNEALETLQLALHDFQQLPDQSTEIRLEEAKVVGNRGYAHKMLGQTDRALSSFQESLNLFRDLRSAHYEAYTLEQIGLVYSIIGGTSEAVSVYDDALRLRRSIGPQDKRNQQQIAALLDLKGRVHAQMNDFSTAMVDYQKALSLAREAGYHDFVVLTLNDIGALRLKHNNPLQAERDHRQALGYLKLHGSEAKAVAETQALLGDAQRAQGKYDSALQNYHQALALQEGTTDVIGQAQTHFSLGMLEAAERHWPEAQQSFTRAAELYEGSGAFLGESNARFQNAATLSAQGNFSQARKELENAIDLGEVVRILAPGPELRTSYFASVEQMYRAEIDLILKEEGPRSAPVHLEAFEVFQRAQSRTLLDALGSKVRSLQTEYSEPDTSAIAEQKNRLRSLVNLPLGAEGKKEILREIKQMKASLRNVEAESVVRQPRLGLFFNVVSANDIKQRILDPDSALIQFYLAEPSSYAWIITQSGVDLVKLPSKAVLERNVRLALQFGIGGQWTASQGSALHRLRQSLAPVFLAATKKRWIVMPDGALHSFPLTMLTSLPGQGLYPEEIIKVPSVPAIDMIRRAESNPRPPYELAIFADPVFDDFDSRLTTQNSRQLRLQPRSGINRSRIEPGESLPRLRYTLAEARELTHVFPANQSRSFLGFEATRDAALGNALQNFRILHFATHSLPDERHPEFSKIVLSRVKPDGSPQAGELFAKDIYQMNLSADLVVLSSCRGAIGKQQPGEGPMSLARAFLFAGSKAVVASLWEVNDEATAALMQSFYRHMEKDKLPPSAALASAQAEFRKRHDQLQNPYYWAGFELYGEWIGR